MVLFIFDYVKMLFLLMLKVQWQGRFLQLFMNIHFLKCQIIYFTTLLQIFKIERYF
jgi:hypothetical protein